ncbi:MAG: DUF3810 domain-containing protein [Clostridia bacterium]|nr:DUF3810 domain-containing protein [Clostridia bacterium]
MKRVFVSSMILIMISATLNMLAVFSPEFSQWYAEHIFTKWTTMVSRLFSFTCNSVFEWIIVIGLILLIYNLLKQRRRIRQKQMTVRDCVCQDAGVVLFILAVAYLIFMISFGINYHRTPFYESEQIKRTEYGVEDLIHTCEYLTDQVNNEAKRMRLDTWGSATVNEANVENRATETFARASDLYPSLSGYVPKPKTFKLYQGMSSQLLMGISIPFTMEAHYNDDMPSFQIPDTICHEFAHIKGFMREEEAGFIAYLVCISSPYSDFRYSGYLSAYTYCMNDLYKCDRINYLRIRDKLCKTASDDLIYNTKYWNEHEGWFSRFSDRMNDLYLKWNHQEQGVLSYRLMTDLVVSYYLQTQ